ncbi:YrbL family protein [Parasulfitobacter algicola]|uniref:PhoP regulatory network protein YrbL n=1 Tax=Parasulfitobacter algicola TaxID=2614809 RepID=A0ABX2IL31_9RHOB|nr:YrbL family protein [Sulfitobacter algicola]NSX53568.1 hypothetical protein [Sulfitobacter algicola]
MLIDKQPLILNDKQPLARGSKRAIYTIDDMPNVMVKVLLRGADHLDAKGAKRIVRQLFPSTYYRFLFREYDCYLRAKLQQDKATGEMPISELRGLVQTDLGLGMLVERIGLKDQPTGPRLRDLAKQGSLQDYIPLLDDFAQRMFSWRIRANDINSSNIVFGHRNGHDQFVLIDGFGDSHLIPLRKWSDTINERSLNKRFAGTAERVNLVWHPDTRTFSQK